MNVFGADGPVPVDILAVGAHPDDLEITMGGTIARLAAAGRRIGLVDLTRGESGSRGAPEIRLEESRAAAAALGASFRVNLALPDGDLSPTNKARAALIRVIRQAVPSIVVSHHTLDPHPDHAGAYAIVRSACHHAGLAKLEPDLPPHRPKYFFTFAQPHRLRPTFLVDVSDFWAAKLDAIRCHHSQVAPRRPGEPATYLGQPDFLDVVAAHCRSMGAMVGVQYAEGFHSEGYLLVDDPLAAFGRKQGRLL
jgi:bacillithiol biosynthesis deacetylase BshB1